MVPPYSAADGLNATPAPRAALGMRPCLRTLFPARIGCAGSSSNHRLSWLGPLSASGAEWVPIGDSHQFASVRTCLCHSHFGTFRESRENVCKPEGTGFPRFPLRPFRVISVQPGNGPRFPLRPSPFREGGETGGAKRGGGHLSHNQSPLIARKPRSTSPVIAPLARDVLCLASAGMRSETIATASAY